MEVLRSHLKLGVSLLICGTVLACTCAAYDTEVRHTWNRLLRAAGFGAVLRYVVTRETIVAAGNEVKVDGRRVTVTEVPAEALSQRFAWARIHQKDGWIAFKGETLETVAAEFNEHNGRQLVIGDVATGRLRVGGKFRLTDLDGFLAALRVTHGVRAIPSPARGRKPAGIVLIGVGAGAGYSDESDER